MAEKFNWTEALAGGGLVGVTRYLDDLTAESQYGRRLGEKVFLNRLTSGSSPKERALNALAVGPEGVLPGLTRQETEVIAGLRSPKRKPTLTDTKLKIYDKVTNPRKYGLPTKQELMTLYPPNIYNVEAGFYEGLIADIFANYNQSGTALPPPGVPGERNQDLPKKGKRSIEEFFEGL